MSLKAAIVGVMERWDAGSNDFCATRVEVTLVGRSSRVRYADYDVVMVAVPIDVTCDMIAQVAPCLKPDAVLFDITSIKREPVKQMLASAHKASSS